MNLNFFFSSRTYTNLGGEPLNKLQLRVILEVYVIEDDTQNLTVSKTHVMNTEGTPDLSFGTPKSYLITTVNPLMSTLYFFEIKFIRLTYIK